MTHFAVWALVLSILAPIIVSGAFRLSAERLWPVAPVRTSRDGLNIVAFLIWFTTQLVLSPGLALFGTLATNHFGGGLIALPTRGWGQAGGFLLYFLVADLAQYLFHRAEHAFPWLWSLHSLHHADTSVDATTSVLHHWMLPIIGTFMVTVPMGLLFKVPPIYAAIYSIIGYHGYLMHANVRLDFGRFAWLVTSPSYHRVHHSAQPEHFDCNYATILPIFDVLFGTYRPAGRGEWPTVGLGDGGEPKSVFDLVFWPVRESLRAWIKRPLGGAKPNA